MSDAFSKYALSLFTDPSSHFAPNTPFGQQHGTGHYDMLMNDPEYAFASATNPWTRNPGFSDAAKGWVGNSFKRMYQNYLSDESSAKAGGNNQFPGFYDYLRNYDWGKENASMSPQARGYRLGGGVPLSRMVRSFG